MGRLAQFAFATVAAPRASYCWRTALGKVLNNRQRVKNPGKRDRFTAPRKGYAGSADRGFHRRRLERLSDDGSEGGKKSRYGDRWAAAADTRLTLRRYATSCAHRISPAFKVWLLQPSGMRIRWRCSCAFRRWAAPV